MTRRWWWLGLGGVLAGQKRPGVQTCYYPPTGKRCKPANGECPHCGLVAPKFTPKLSDYFADGACIGPRLPPGIKIGQIVSVNAVCRSADKEDLPKFQDIACSHCNAIFRQFAEDIKP